jgi:drug/metabolite transporter (DMT)-like permease
VVAIALALGSSLAWGVSDFLGGLKSRTVPLLTVLLVSQGAALVLLAGIVVAAGEPPPGGSFVLFAALAGLSEAVGVAALYRGLAVGTMSLVAPAAAMAPVVPLVVGIALGEVPGPVQGAGVGLAILGIVITAAGSERTDASAPPAALSIGFGLLCALGFGGFYVAMDAASEGEIPWALLVARTTAVAIFVAAMAMTRSSLVVRRQDVAVIASIALARLYLNERVERRQQLGIVACLCGVVAISAAA